MGGKCGTGSTRLFKGYAMVTFKLCTYVCCGIVSNGWRRLDAGAQS